MAHYPAQRLIPFLHLLQADLHTDQSYLELCNVLSYSSLIHSQQHLWGWGYGGWPVGWNRQSNEMGSLLLQSCSRLLLSFMLYAVQKVGRSLLCHVTCWTLSSLFRLMSSAMALSLFSSSSMRWAMRGVSSAVGLCSHQPQDRESIYTEREDVTT